jgi:hypothetical protein
MGFSIGGENGLGLDGVSEGGSCAVSFDDVDVLWREPRAVERLPNDTLLGRAIGSGEALAPAVLVDGGASKDGEDGVTVSDGIGEALEQEHPGALGPARTVGFRRERLAATIGGKASLATESNEGRWGGHDGHPAGESESALALPQSLASEVSRDERRAAGSVDGESGTFEAEGIGDAAGSHAGSATHAEVALVLSRSVGQSEAVIVVHDADEDTALASLERGRVNACTLEGFPGGLEEEPLLGIDGERFARADAEEGGLEVIGVVEKAAFARVALALSVGVGIEEGIEIPTAILGEAGDGVFFVEQELPEVFGRMYAAREAATHRHDGDGVFVGRRGEPHARTLGVAAKELRREEARERSRGWIVEEEGGLESQASGGGETISELEGHERIEAELLKRAMGIERFERGQAEDGGGFGADEIEEDALAFGGREGGEALCKRRGQGGIAGGLACDASADETLEQRGHPAGIGAERVHVEACGHQSGLGSLQSRIEEGESLACGEGSDAGALHASGVGGAKVVGHCAALGPVAPCERAGREPLGAPVMRKGIEEGIGCGVVGLTWATEDASSGREEDEGGEGLVFIKRELVQVPSGIELGCKDAVDALGVHAAEQPVVEGAGGMDDGGERVSARDGVQEGLEGAWVGHVARGEGDRGPQSLELALQDLGARSARALSGGEEQVFDAVVCDEVVCDQGAERAGASGDEDGAFGVKGVCRVGGSLGQPSQTRDEGFAVAESELMLARVECVECAEQGVLGGFAAVKIDEEERELRVFALRGACEPPERGVSEVEDVFVSVGGDGALGEQDEARGGEAFVGKNALQQGEGARGGGAGALDEVVGGRSDKGDDDEAWRRSALVERAAEGSEVGAAGERRIWCEAEAAGAEKDAAGGSRR